MMELCFWRKRFSVSILGASVFSVMVGNFFSKFERSVSSGLFSGGEIVQSAGGVLWLGDLLGKFLFSGGSFVFAWEFCC